MLHQHLVISILEETKMKVICSNIGIEGKGQLEWEGPANQYTKEIDKDIKTASIEKSDGQFELKDRVKDAGHIFEYHLTDEDRKQIAYKTITKFYPEWKQLNIIQDGGEELAKMNSFIKLVRDWSNGTSNDPFSLENAEP